MLAAIIQNLQNVGPSPRPPLVKVEHGGGGGGPRYWLVDYFAALESFQEIAGEHPVLRAARRQRHVEQTLPLFKDQRERREGAAFLAGAVVGERAAEERWAASDAEQKLKIEQLIQIIDDARKKSAAPPVAPLVVQRGLFSDGGSSAAGPLLFVGGLVLGLALTRRARRRK